MPTVDDILVQLEEFAPLSGAEEWDNVGLLVGDRGRVVTRLMTCLTLTPASAAEAIKQRAELVVVHHPLPFRPLTRITTETTPGRLLWDLIGAGVSVFSAHTAFDSAAKGINQQWAEGLKLTHIEPLVESLEAAAEVRTGAGRCGDAAGQLPLLDLCENLKRMLSIDRVRIVGDEKQLVKRVAVACGSGGSFLEAARAKGCDCFVTGEASFHTCLEAESAEMSLVLCGHFASERFAMEQLAATLANWFPEVAVWASRTERDPLRMI
jgi:dinuclear metal center YbgI/SA1388 family protein